MSVAEHLRIQLDEYDARIRTFIPGYDDMIGAAAAAIGALDPPSPHIVDLGTGTGALAAACLRRRPGARVTAIDEDPAILDLARRRLAEWPGRAVCVHASFVSADLPPCDAVVASLALHHIRTAEAKRELYRRCRGVVGPRGLLVSADCYPASDAALAALERDRWRAHLRCTYTDAETEAFFAAWAQDDVYFCVDEEVAMLRDARFAPDVVWRANAMTVVAARAV